MQEVILYIQPQVRTGVTQDYVRADLIEPELITLTQVIQDVKEIDQIFTNYSRTFNLPASKKNNILFKRWYNPDIVGFDNQIMANARIELNHLPFKEGKIKLESVTMKHGQPSLYKITFFGSTVSLSNLIGEEQLDNLTWLNNFNFNANNDNIKAGLSSGLDFTVDSVSYTDGVIYPLITHSNTYIYDNATGATNQDNPLNIAYSSAGSNLGKRGVFPSDLKPAIKVSLIIKAIEQQYNLSFKTGGFFASAAMTNLYLWLHRDKQDLNSSNFIIVDNLASTGSNGTNSTGVIYDFTHFTDPTYNAYFNTSTSTYKFFDTGTDSQGFSAIYEITPDTSYLNTEYTLEVVSVLDGTVYGVRQGLTGVDGIAVNFGHTGTGLIDSISININEVFEIAIKVTSSVSMTFTQLVNVRHLTVNSQQIPQEISRRGIFTGNTNVALVTSINVVNQIPEIKILDFLRGLFKMHNLTAFVDNQGDIIVKTLDSFYSSGDTLDLTKYINTDSHSIANTLPFTEIDFEYSEAKTILAQQFEQSNNRKYGELEFVSGASKGETFKMQVSFEHILFERLNDINTGGAISQTDIQYGAFINDNLEPSIGQPLLFYGIYRENVSTPINFAYNNRTEDGSLPASSGVNFNLNDYWMPHNANELGTTTTAPTYNLNFGSEINSYTLTDYSGINNSLFQLYYQNYILRVFNKRTRLFNYKAILPLNILLKLSLDDTIIIQERAFTINKMTTKLQSGETEFELLNEPT